MKIILLSFILLKINHAALLFIFLLIDSLPAIGGSRENKLAWIEMREIHGIF
jgi:hypothetical protein